MIKKFLKRMYFLYYTVIWGRVFILYNHFIIKNYKKLHFCDTQWVKSVAIFSSGDTSTVVSFVIMPSESLYDIKRCLLIFAKQRRKDIQIIIVADKYVRPITVFAKRVMKGIADVLIVQINNCCDLHNVHTTTIKYVKGKYVTFIRASDIIHPAYSLYMPSYAKSLCADLVLHGSACGKLFFKNLLSESIGAKQISYDDLMKTRKYALSFSNEDIFHSLFRTEKLKNIVEAELTKKIVFFSPLLHLLLYIKSCNKIVYLSSSLVKKRTINSESCSIKKIFLYIHALTSELFPFYIYLQEKLGSKHSQSILKHIVFTTVPSTLSILLNRRLNISSSAIIYSAIAFYSIECIRIFPQCQQKILAHTFAGLNYGRFMASSIVHSIHQSYIKKGRGIAKGITLYDERNLPELKNHLMPELQKRFSVIHLEKNGFVEHRQLEILVHAVLSAQTVLILSSQLVHKNLTSGRKVLQVWHGCGFLKRVEPPAPFSSFAQDYRVASSEACRSVYPEIYGLASEKILTLGSPQTDRYFDREKVAEARSRASAEFQDIAGKRICFFAPTFRQWHKQRRYADPPHYRCGWNYEEMDVVLQQANTIILYKKHQKIISFTENTLQNFCDLHDSPGRTVRATTRNELFDWVCACDIFMTDYSSAMLYPLLLNKPLVFYAPDIDEYCEQGNGLYIDYRREVPGPIVEHPSPSALIEAMDAAPSFVHSQKYLDFKEKHIGSCDGHSTERLLDFLDTWYASEEKRINRRVGEFS